MKSNVQRSALALFWILLLVFTIAVPLYLPMSSWDNPALTLLGAVGLLAGVIVNWILLIIFVKKGWNKVILLLLFWPVFRTCAMIGRGKPLWALNSIFFVLGLCLLIQPDYFQQSLKRRFKIKVSPSLIRILGGLIAIASVFITF